MVFESFEIFCLFVEFCRRNIYVDAKDGKQLLG